MSGRVHVVSGITVGGKGIEELCDRIRREAFAEAVRELRLQPSFTHEQREALWAIENLATDGIEVRPEALGVCGRRHAMDRYCSGYHCDHCLAVRELDDRYGREVTNLALQRARVEGVEEHECAEDGEWL